jgi:hypothetical protein
VSDRPDPSPAVVVPVYRKGSGPAGPMLSFATGSSRKSRKSVAGRLTCPAGSFVESVRMNRASQLRELRLSVPARASARLPSLRAWEAVAAAEAGRYGLTWEPKPAGP